jgi:hypothetical protein
LIHRPWDGAEAAITPESLISTGIIFWDPPESFRDGSSGLDTRSGITVTRIAGRVDSLDQEIEEMKKSLDALKRTVGVGPPRLSLASN